MRLPISTGHTDQEIEGKGGHHMQMQMENVAVKTWLARNTTTTATATASTTTIIEYVRAKENRFEYTLVETSSIYSTLFCCLSLRATIQNSGEETKKN